MELSKIKGVGAKRLQQLNEKNIFTSQDLVNFLPIRYEDMTTIITNITENIDKNVLIKGTITKPPVTQYFNKRLTTRVTVNCGDFVVNCMWFNQPYVKSNLTADEDYFFYGKVKESKGKYSLFAPSFEKCNSEKNRMSGINPKYRKIDGVSSAVISKAVGEIVKTDNLLSIIPKNIQMKFELTSLHQGYEMTHFPKVTEEIQVGVKRITYENMVKTMLSHHLFDNAFGNKVRDYSYCDVLENLCSVLDFEMYSSQKKAIEEIFYDMKSGNQMNRLLQGDVGSGKSIVILASCLMAAMSGFQSAVMCPTTTLAKQHFKNFKEICDKLGVTVGLLTGYSNNQKEVVDQLNSGEIQIVVGTHSLISDRVHFKNLAFCSIDEQQKFGVGQRAKLIEKGEKVDVLTATATPIPRSLTLMMYGELKVSYIFRNSVLNSVSTHIINSTKTNDCYQFMKKQIDAGGMAYVVCPKIYDDEIGESEGAVAKFKELKTVFKGYRVGLIHGDMKPQDREIETDKFSNGEFDLLVSTSVIEVGIDNKKANVMLIFDGENFGLSSLHQLRGRVGRMGQESFCFLSVDNANEVQRDRLKFFKENNDGFAISDYDLAVRGAGDYFGSMQSGKSADDFLINMNFSDVVVVKEIVECMLSTIGSNEITILAKQLEKNTQNITLN